jgi:hypothetical protein
MNNQMNSQKGLSLYLAVMLTAIILAIVFGITTILLVQLEAIKGMENSVVAFYAADTGIEQVLMDRSNPIVFNECISEFDLCLLDPGDPNGPKYYVVVDSTGSNGCTASKFCIKSAGIYKGTKRSIEVRY